MELMKAIKGRRAFRAFKPDLIPEETLYKILEAAAFAFSGANQPTWGVVVVRDKETKEKIVKVSLNQTFLSEAPVLLVFCGSRVWDILQAVDNAMLAAYELGFGACCVGSTDYEKVAEILGVKKEFRILPEKLAKLAGAPEEMKVHVLVPIGKTREQYLPTNPGKRCVWEIAHFDQWGNQRIDKVQDILRALMKDTENALNDFIRGRENIIKELGYGDTLYRWEEKYAAFSYPNLVRRWMNFSRLLKEKSIYEIDEEFLKESEKTVDEYETGRWNKISKEGDINSEVVLEHERRHSTEVFPNLLRKWLNIGEKMKGEKLEASKEG